MPVARGAGSSRRRTRRRRRARARPRVVLLHPGHEQHRRQQSERDGVADRVEPRPEAARSERIAQPARRARRTACRCRTAAGTRRARDGRAPPPGATIHRPARTARARKPHTPFADREDVRSADASARHRLVRRFQPHVGRGRSPKRCSSIQSSSACQRSKSHATSSSCPPAARRARGARSGRAHVSRPARRSRPRADRESRPARRVRRRRPPHVAPPRAVRPGRRVAAAAGGAGRPAARRARGSRPRPSAQPACVA